MKNLLSYLAIIASIAIFILVVRPQYEQIGELNAKDAELEGVLSNARQLQSMRDSLLEKRNTISNADIQLLEKMIPDSADNVKLILEFEQTAQKYNLEIASVSASKEEKAKSGGLQEGFDIETNDYGVVTLDFSLRGDYENFLLFIRDIERNLRLTDIRSLDISTSQTDSYVTFQYKITIDTYWLKDALY